MPWKEIIVIRLVFLWEKKKKKSGIYIVLVRKVAVLSFCVLNMKVGAFLLCTLGNEYIFVRFLFICDFMILLCDFLLRKQIIVILPAFLSILY